MYSLIGVDGNAFAIMGYVVAAMRKEHYNKQTIEEYKKEAMSSDYNHLIAVSCAAVDILNDSIEK